ncbi:MAG TPA: hypothetical protein VGP72_22570 [Planctomycetota bacterium]|jgi:hypothetical protein
MYTPNDPHLTVALVLGPIFGQFCDPLDWVCERLGLDVKVDRQQLMESLANRGGGVADATFAKASALGNDKVTRFSIELFGRCEGKMVALCKFTFSPRRVPLRMLEERATAMVSFNERLVLGMQATLGKLEHSLEGLEREAALIRLLPLNVFNRSFFQAKLELIANDKKLKILDAGTAAIVELTKPWLFYDVPKNARATARKHIGLLPF